MWDTHIKVNPSQVYGQMGHPVDLRLEIMQHYILVQLPQRSILHPGLLRNVGHGSLRVDLAADQLHLSEER